MGSYVEFVKELFGEYEVFIFEREEVLFYLKFMLSYYIVGLIEKEKFFIYFFDWYERKGINLKFGEEVKLIDRVRKVFVMDKGEYFYDIFVIVIGVRVREFIVDGKEYFFIFRSIEDVEGIKVLFEEYGEVVIIGGGFIGFELVGNFVKVGYGVKLIYWRDIFFGFDEEFSSLIREKLEELGVEFYFGVEFLKVDENGFLIIRGYIEGKVKICVIGIILNVEIVRRSGIYIGRGILIDDYFRIFVKDVYVIGDCVEYSGIICGIVKVVVGYVKVLVNFLRGKEDCYFFEFCFLVFKFGDLLIVIIGKMRGEGEWFDEYIKVFF